MIKQTQRSLSKIADRLPYHRGASARFDGMVTTRRSWAFWFVARVAIANTPDMRK